MSESKPGSNTVSIALGVFLGMLMFAVAVANGNTTNGLWLAPLGGVVGFVVFRVGIWLNERFHV